MNPLSIIANLLSAGASLKNIFGNGPQVIDVDKLISDIVSQLSVIIHAEITQNDIIAAKALGQTMVDNISKNYLLAQKTGKTVEELISIIDGFDIIGLNTGSPLSQANLMVEICNEPSTRPQEVQQAASMYILIVTLILSILQEKARLLDSIKKSNELAKEEIKTFAKQFSDNTIHLYQILITGRSSQVSDKEKTSKKESGPTFDGYIYDKWMDDKEPVLSVNLRPIVTIFNIGITNAIGIIFGEFNTYMPAFQRWYKKSLESEIDVSGLQQALQRLPKQYPSGNSVLPVEFKFLHGSAEKLYAEIKNFQQWRIDYQKTSKGIETLITNPLGKA